MGIAVGCVVAAVFIVAAVFFFWRRKRTNAQVGLQKETGERETKIDNIAGYYGPAKELPSEVPPSEIDCSPQRHELETHPRVQEIADPHTSQNPEPKVLYHELP